MLHSQLTISGLSVDSSIRRTFGPLFPVLFTIKGKNKGRSTGKIKGNKEFYQGHQVQEKNKTCEEHKACLLLPLGGRYYDIVFAFAQSTLLVNLETLLRS